MSLTLEVAITPIAFVQAILMAYERYSRDPTYALQRAQITPELLADPQSNVTGSQMQTLFGIAIQELNDEALGWFSRRLPWGSYGMLCRAALGSPTLEVALKRWCRYHSLLTDDLTLQFTLNSTAASITIQVNRDLGEMAEFCFATLFRYILGYACWAINSRIPLLEACFPCAIPDHLSVYQALFPGPLHFHSKHARISFDPQYTAMPIRRDDQALSKMLQHALPLTMFPYRRDRLLVQRVYDYLKMRPDGLHTGESIAKEFHVSARTLHRQLQEEGASLQALKDEVRRARAIDLLNKTSRPIKQIALAVGFLSEKSFSRAFKQWTGMTPESLREMGQHLGS